MKLTNAKHIIDKAFEKGYAVPHININNLEWTKVILLTSQKMKSPVILGASEGAISYMGGFNTIIGMVKGMVKDLKITIPVVLHLDHGSFEGAKTAIELGWTSVMFDGSKLSFDQNYRLSKEIIKLAKKHRVSVEVEVGSIGGEEDGIIGTGEIADPIEVEKIASLEPDMIAAGINNIHGKYPINWKGLDFEVLKKLKETGQKPIVLHGGSGIPNEQIKKAITLGVAKINVNTELQIANALAIEEFVVSGQIKLGKNYDPRKLLAPGVRAMEKIITEKIKLFGSQNKA